MSEPVVVRRGFPIILTVCYALALVVLLALGTWQVQRMQWKNHLLARIEQLKAAPARPLAEVLRQAKAGEDVAWTRVAVTCVQPAGAPLPDHVRNAVRDGEIVWRVASTCRLPEGAPYAAILVDRGVFYAATGEVEKPSPTLGAVIEATGVLTPLSDLSREALDARPAGSPDLMLMVERETPPPAGVKPAPLPPEIPNRHLEYALTWYGLAAALTGVYFALLRRRLKS